MNFPDFGALPPEINSALMYAGPGSGPMLAASAAWDGLATELGMAANSYGSMVSTLSSGPWTGPSSTVMAAAAAPYVAWMNTTATQAEGAANGARAAAAAYETAFAMHVPPPVATEATWGASPAGLVVSGAGVNCCTAEAAAALAA